MYDKFSGCSFKVKKWMHSLKNRLKGSIIESATGRKVLADANFLTHRAVPLSRLDFVSAEYFA